MPKFAQLSERFQRLKAYWEELGGTSSSSRGGNSDAAFSSASRLTGGSLRKLSSPVVERPLQMGSSTDCISGQYGDSEIAAVVSPVRAQGSKGVRASGRGTVKQGIRKRFEVFEELSTNGLDSRKGSFSDETKAERAEIFLRYQAEKLQDRSKYKSVFYDRVGPEFEDPAAMTGVLQASSDDLERAGTAGAAGAAGVNGEDDNSSGGGSGVGVRGSRVMDTRGGVDEGGDGSKRRSSQRQHRSSHQRGMSSSSSSGSQSGELAGRLTGSGPGRTLWCNMREVREAGLLERLSKEEIKLQEAQFEIITSEASYYKNLLVLIEIFYNSSLFDHTREDAIVNALDKHHLFSNIVDIFECSTTFLKALEEQWKKSLQMDWIGSVILDSLEGLKVYKDYCRNFYYQTKTLQKLTANPDFLAQLSELERHPDCRRIAMQSYLEMPMKRVMSLQLLMDAVMRRMPGSCAGYATGMRAQGQLLSLARECDQESRMMWEKEQMLKLQNQLSFSKVKKVGCWGGGRHLIKEGQARVLSASPNTQGFYAKLTLKKNYVQLHAFSDLLIVSKPKSDQGFQVLKHCPRTFVDAECLPAASSSSSSAALASSASANSLASAAAAAASAVVAGGSASPQKQPLRLRLVDASDGTPPVTLLLELRSREEADQWVQIFCPRDELGDPVYEPDDCPQAQAVKAYRPLQSDDLELRVGDVVNIYKKTEDGWFLGSRLTRLDFRGWFPGSHVREIENEHYTAKLRKVSFRRKSSTPAYARHRKA